MEDIGNVHKKASSEMLFAEYGRSYEDGEDPTPENRRVVDLYEPVDAMSLNREKDRMVVVGIRGVVQLVKIEKSYGDVNEGPAIIKDVDMRAYRRGRVNILYSAQNVRWNQIYDQYIATTSSNGSIVCWNVNRKNKSIYKAHERAATCLDWHNSAPYILVSGSRDCNVKSYDLRAKNIHQLTFDLLDSCRDVAMCKQEGYEDYFFSGDEGGILRLWDLRQTKRCVIQKVAHRSFISTLSLNPTNHTLLATGGGRDKLVKVWEWNGPDIKRISIIESSAPLARVVWNPARPFQLATCSSVNETTVHVWDIRRPYIPYLTYDEHCDSVTDACWPGAALDMFISCGKDGLVVLHNIDSGHAPITYACDGAFDITPDGIMAVAVNSDVHERNEAAMEAEMIAKSAPITSKKTLHKIPYETFDSPVKSLIGFGCPESLTHSLPPNSFYKIAEKYHIGGMEIVSLCEINSKVSRKAGMEHVAQTWKLVEALCAQAKIQEEYNNMSAEEKLRIIKAWVVRKRELAEEGRRWLGNLADIKRCDVKKIVRERLENTQHVTAFLNYSSGSDSENNSDRDIEIQGRPEEEPKQDELENDGEPVKKKKKRKKVTFTDFYFGGGESNFNEIGGKKELLHLNEFMGLRNEAFDIRDEVAEAKFFCKARKQPTTSEEYERDLKIAEAEFQAWSPMLEIYRLLQYHAEQGDMQTCATVSMVCGKRLFDAVDQYTINGWIMCYMEMLDKLELFLVCAKIRKYCPLESISQVSRENTTIQLSHSDCNAIIINGRCSKCEKPAQSDCTVCRAPIVGMTYQCNVCGHAMHCDHAYEWFQRTVECAFVGCPCNCGQNTWPDMERTFISNNDNPREHRKFDRQAAAEHAIQIAHEKITASRLDSTSEDFTDEDLECSPSSKSVREKLGVVDPIEDKPWGKYLTRMYKRRIRKRKEEALKRKDEDSDEERKNKKENEKKKLRTLLTANLNEEIRDMPNKFVPKDKEGKPPQKKDDFVEDYLDSTESEFEEEEKEEEDFEEQQQQLLLQQQEQERQMEERAYQMHRAHLEEIAEEPELASDDEDYIEQAQECYADDDQPHLRYDAQSIYRRMHDNGAYQYEQMYHPNGGYGACVQEALEAQEEEEMYEEEVEDEVEEEEEYEDEEEFEDEEEDNEIELTVDDIYDARDAQSSTEEEEEVDDEEVSDEEVYDEEEVYEDEEEIYDEEEEEVYDEEEEYEDEQVCDEESEEAEDEEEEGEEEIVMDEEVEEMIEQYQQYFQDLAEVQARREDDDDGEVFHRPVYSEELSDEEVCEDEEEQGELEEEDEQVEEALPNGYTVPPCLNGHRNLEEDFKVVRRLTFADSSENEDPAEKPRNLRKSEMTVKERVLTVLNMTKKSMKKDRAIRKYQQRIEEEKARAEGRSINETTDDEYAVTSDDNSSLGANSSASSTASDHSPHADVFVPAPSSSTLLTGTDSFTSSATVQLSTSRDELTTVEEYSQVVTEEQSEEQYDASPFQHAVHKIIDYHQEHLDEKMKHDGVVFIGVSGAAPLSTSSSSEESSPDLSPTPSIPSFTTKYPLIPSPPPPPMPSEDEYGFEEYHTSSVTQLHISEASDHVPALEQLPVTSIANPIFTRVARRPPLSNPVQIQVNGQPSDRRDGSQTSLSSLFRNNDAFSAPAELAMTNPLFGQISCSLPIHNYTPFRRMRHNTFHNDNHSDFDSGNCHLLSQSNGFLSSEGLGNGYSRRPSWGSRHSSTLSLAGSVIQDDKTVEVAQEAREVRPVTPQAFTASIPTQPTPKPPTTARLPKKKFIGIEIVPELELPDHLNVFESNFLQEKHLEMHQNPEEEEDSDDSVMFEDEDDKTSDEGLDEPEGIFDEEEDEEPFFPQSDDVLVLTSKAHPWETEEQYQNRRQQEEEEEAAERAELDAARYSDDMDDEEEPSCNILGNRRTPMQRALEKLRKQRDKFTPKPQTVEKLQSGVKRVKFDRKMHTETMEVALKNLKKIEPSIQVDEESEEEKGVKAEVCVRCKHQRKTDKQEKDYVRWIRETADEGQIILAKSFNDPCTKYQLEYLEDYLSDLDKAKQTEENFVEFVKLFYFIQWDKIMRPDNEFMLKEVFELWDDFRKKRPRVCDEHYADFSFRFFTSSIAVKIKQTLFSQESVEARREAISMDWAHLKPCVLTLHDNEEDIERMFDTDVTIYRTWNKNEQAVAREYWNVFGTVPLHITTHPKDAVGPHAPDSLEILDDTNYWTKKMLRSLMNKHKNHNIKLSYTKRKKPNELFRVQQRSEQALSNRWKNRLNHMINETPHFDNESNSLRIQTKDGMIHTDDANNPWPVCQIDDGENYVTIRPLVTKNFIEFKSRVRSKFGSSGRHLVYPKSARNFNVTKEDIRKTRSFKRFEPKLKKAAELSAMFSRHFKVVDRREIVTNYELYTIVEEDDEVALIVDILEKQKLLDDEQEVLDPEEVFAERIDLREEKELEVLWRMEEEKYRRTLEDTKKFECARMSILNNHWLPQFKRTFKKAQKAIALGKILVDEDIQKWMEYQYELSFVKKSMKRKSLITRAEMKRCAPLEWQEAINELDFTEPSLPPPYVPIPPKPSSGTSTPSLPSFNSSSEDEKDEEDRNEKHADVKYEQCVDLVGVAAKLQAEYEERNISEDRDDDWKYSDDSSVSTWFGDDCDDILNRLLNVDYMDEHMVLKERSKGALGRKLWEVYEERKEDSETDEEGYADLEELVMEKKIEEKKNEEEDMEEWGDYEDHYGVSDGKKTKEYAEKEVDIHLERHDKKELRNLEMQQLRYFFRQYKLDHSYTAEPFDWSDDFKDPLALLHQNELRRVGNRIHQKMREEYEEKAEIDEMIMRQYPADENSLQNKMLNFLLFGQSGESFQDVTKKVNAANKVLQPMKKYEMFFGQEGVVQLKRISDEVMQCMNLRSSIRYMCSQLGKNMRIPRQKLIGFLKLWWCSSPQTLQSFVRVCQDSYLLEEKIIDELVLWDQLPQHIDLVRETVDELEIGLMLNDVLYVVELYVEETETMFKCALSSEDQIAFSTMDVWDWHEMKYGYPYMYGDLGEAKKKLMDAETEDSSEEETETSSGSEGTSDSEEVTENGSREEGSKRDAEDPSNSHPENNSDDSNEEFIDTLNPDPTVLHQALISHYKEIYKELKVVEAERKERDAEANARKLLEEWDGYEEDQAWEVDDIGRKIREFLAMEVAVRENARVNHNDPVPSIPNHFDSWDDELEKIKSGEIDEPEMALYTKPDINRYEMLEMCGLPVSLDHEMFSVEMNVVEPAGTSIADAKELAKTIEKGFEDEECEILTVDIDDDAQSYSSVKHVLKHELYFQREMPTRLVPSCVVLFSPEMFFEDLTDINLNFNKWKRIIEASNSPYSFNRLVMRERLFKKCRDEFCYPLIEKYFDSEDREFKKILEVFERCMILVVVDTELNPWTCRVVCRDDVSQPVYNRKAYLRKLMVEDSQRDLICWLNKNKIDMEVYSRCPVVVEREGPLSLDDADKMTDILMEEHIRDDWLSIWKSEGIRALDAMIRMPPPPESKLECYKAIFKPIYDAWYLTWKFENDRSGEKTIVKRKPNRVKEYMHKSKIIVNYAHQHYRMKRFDNLLSKDPTGFHTMDRSDVPSASLFDSLDAAVTKFCEQDSPHLNATDKLIVRDALIQLATGKIPHFTINYFGATDYTEEQEVLNHTDDEDEDDKPPQPITETGPVGILAEDKHDQDEHDEEYEWLRSMYEENDMDRRRFMARILFEIAQKAMYRFAPNLANFEGAQRKFEHLLTLHAKQRPLLDMMLTKVRGTYFMPLETNMFLYQHKLITFGELVESQVHPRDMRDEKFTLEKLRRQEPRDSQQMSDFLDGLAIDSDSDESGSDVSSDPSSSDPSSMSGSTESLDEVPKRKKRKHRKTVAKAQREDMVHKLRSKPKDPDETFAKEKRALGPKLWRTRRKINDMLEGIADLDRTRIKLPDDKMHLLDHIGKLIVENSDTAHWSWGELKMKTRINCIPPIHRMKLKHVDKIKKGLKTYQPAKKYDSKNKKEDGRKWF